MSAYLTSKETRSIITKSIKHYSKNSEIYLEYPLKKYHSKNEMEWLNPENKEFEQRFFYLLTNVNMVSLGQRYDDIDSWGDEAKNGEYDKNAPIVKIPFLIRLMDNWTYQSCEGLAEETDFYKLIQELKSKLAFYFLEKNHPVEAWGVDSYEEIKEKDLEIPRNAVLISSMFIEL